MKTLLRAGALALALLSAAPALADVYTVLVWDPRFPAAAPIRITTTDRVAAAMVQGGVATPANPGDYGYLLGFNLGGTSPVVTVGTFDFSDPAQSGLLALAF